MARYPTYFKYGGRGYRYASGSGTQGAANLGRQTDPGRYGIRSSGYNPDGYVVRDAETGSPLPWTPTYSTPPSSQGMGKLLGEAEPARAGPTIDMGPAINMGDLVAAARFAMSFGPGPLKAASLLWDLYDLARAILDAMEWLKNQNYPYADPGGWTLENFEMCHFYGCNSPDNVGGTISSACNGGHGCYPPDSYTGTKSTTILSTWTYIEINHYIKHSLFMDWFTPHSIWHRIQASGNQPLSDLTERPREVVGVVPAPPSFIDPMPRPGTSPVAVTSPLVRRPKRPSPYLVEQDMVTYGPRDLKRRYKSPFIKMLEDRKLDVQLVLLQGTTKRTRYQDELSGNKPKVKPSLPGWARVVMRAIGTATEVGDTIDALYWALPPDCRRKNGGKSVSRKVNALLACGDRMNGAKALENIARNEIGDRAIAAGNRQAAQSLIDANMYGVTGRPFGGNSILGKVL